MIKIDKSVFSAEELDTYNALIAKASVNPEEAQEEMKTEIPSDEPKKKTTEKAEVETMEEAKKSVAAPGMEAALERLEKLEKSIEMKEFSEIAKKYAPLGENEEDLAKSLYEMKKSSEDSYHAYIAVLDKSLGLVEKTGVFAEIGKSASGTAGSTVEKIEAAADEIMKSDAGLSREQAIAKAWIDHPELVAEYDAEYKA